MTDFEETFESGEFRKIRFHSSRFPQPLKNAIRRLKRTYKTERLTAQEWLNRSRLIDLLELEAKKAFRNEQITLDDYNDIKYCFKINF